MSIKSQKGGGSDIPLHSKDRAPNSMFKRKMKGGLKPESIDNVSPFVEANLKYAVKPRGKENR